MDVEDTESNEPGEYERVDQPAVFCTEVPDAVEKKDCTQSEEDDDGEIESESGGSISEASSDAVENAASSDAEQIADCSDPTLKSRNKQDIAKELHTMQTDSFHENAENEASDKKTEILEGEEGYFDDDDRSQTPLQDEPDAGSEFSQSGGVDDNESIENVRVLGTKDVSSNENQQRPESDEVANGNAPNIPDTTLGGGGVPPEVSRKHSVRDDLGELDYEEDENQDEDSGNSVADSSGEELGEESLNKKVIKKDLKKREKVTKEETSEKEEGEESEDGEEKDDEHSTDGELDDDDDCEDGEIKEPGQKKTFVRPICRFYMRGNCTWGHSCRFLHPGVNDKGPPPPGMMLPPPMGMPGGRGHLPPPPGPWMHEVPPRRLPRGPMEMGPPVIEPEHPTPAPEVSNESAWERGLRHAKEIRKKRKETDDDKKPSSPKEERVTSPLPAPAREIPAHLPPPREAFFEELPAPGPVLPVFEEDFYGRPVLPPPPEAWPFRPPFDPYDPRWVRGPPLEFPHPPHFMPPPPDFRIPERDRGHRFSPPPRFDGRRDPRFNPWFDRFHPDGPGRDQAHPMAGGDVPAPAVRGRGEEWKDPWLRSRSPKRKQNSSSRSVSRGRRRYRSRSKGSFSSVSSSSYSSNSRSRSGSSSSYTSYSKSSYSRSSYSSRSSSASRSRSRSGRKPLPATTLGQSLLEKRKVHSEVHRPNSSNTNELAIGSGPLPARAPPEKKPQQSVSTQSQGKSITPRPVAPPAVQEMSKPAVSVGSPAVGNAPSAKSLPKLSQPIPLSSRTALQPVGREVAAAFTDHEETWNDPNSAGKGVETSNLQPSSPLADNMDSLKEKLGSSRERSGALSRGSSGGGGEKDAGSVPLRDIPVTRMGDRSGMLETGSRNDRTENKVNSSREYETSGRQQTDQSIEKARLQHGQVTAKEGALVAKQSSNRAKDHVERSKLEVGKNVMGRRLSNNSARSISAESKRSLSSLSSSSSEHLYDDIASPISSTSSLSPEEPMTKGGKNSSVPNQSAVPKLRRPPSPRKLRPKTPPLQQPYPPVAAHKVEKPRSNVQRESTSRAEPRESTRLDRRGDAQRLGTRDGAAMPYRTASHRADSQRQPPSRGFPPDHAIRDIRRDAGGARDRDSTQHAPPGMLSSQHRDSASRRAGVSGSHGSGTRVSDDARLRSTSGARNALPPPPRPSEGSMSFRPGLDARMMSSNAKSETKGVSKSDRMTSVAAHSSSVSSSRKRSAEHGSEMPSTKHMRHASDVRYPVKIPVPRKPSAVSPNRSGARSSGTSTTVALKSPVKTAPPVPPPKLPVQPPSSTSHSANSVAKPRKSTSSRREELLMQLKAVEDAIAKKRSKLQ